MTRAPVHFSLTLETAMRRDLRRALALLSLVEPSEIVFLIVLCAATYGLLSLGGM